jgi:hypothetical protein
MHGAMQHYLHTGGCFSSTGDSCTASFLVTCTLPQSCCCNPHERKARAYTNSLFWGVHPAGRLATTVAGEKGGKLLSAVCCHTHTLRFQVL